MEKNYSVYFVEFIFIAVIYLKWYGFKFNLESGIFLIVSFILAILLNKLKANAQKKHPK